MAVDLDLCWTQQPVSVLDFETCSLRPEDGVVEIAVARFENRVCVASWSSLINPGRPIPAAATDIHGITDADVAGAPTLVDVASELLNQCWGAIPCAYSAEFDRGFLHHQITGTDCRAFDPAVRWLDPLVIVRKVDRYVSGKGRHKLEATCRRYGIRIDQAHRAKADAIACGTLLYTLLQRGAVRPCPLGKMLSYIDEQR